MSPENQGRPERRGDGPRGPRNSSSGARQSGPKRDGAASGGYKGRPEDARGASRGDKPAGGGYQGRPENARGASRGDKPAGGGYKGRPENARGGDRSDRPVKREGNTPGRVGPEIEVPDIPDEVTFDQLDQTARARLRTLSKDNAEDVGRHLVMAGKLLDIDPERAYKHAQVAAARGGRVDIVREAAALTAYATGRFAEALKEFRTVRRLSGSGEHLALMADCERGLGRPERAIALSQEDDAKTLEPAARAELQIVVAGARLDMKDPEAALLVLSRVQSKDPAVTARVDEAKIDVLRALGRDDEAKILLEALPASADDDEETWADEVWLYDTEELPAPPPELSTPASTVPESEPADIQLEGDEGKAQHE